MKLKKFFHDEKGAVIPLVAFFIFFVALGVSAIVVDVGTLYVQRRSMVTAADAGALAGAKSLNDLTLSLTDVENIAKEVAVINGADSDKVSATATRTGTPNVKVDTVHNTELFFAKTFGIETSDVSAYAVAQTRKLLNPGLIPLFMLDTEYENMSDGQLNYVHDKKVTINGVIDGVPTDVTLNWSAGMMYFDDNISGIPGITKYLGDRDIAIPDSLISNLTFPKQYIPGKSGLGQIDQGTDVKNIFYSWFQEAFTHSKSPSERRAYMTGFVPVVDTQRYLEMFGKTADGSKENNTKNFPIAYFAEVVIIDYVSGNDGVGESNAMVYIGENAYKNQVTTPYDWDTLLSEETQTMKTIILMKTGKEVQLNDMISGNWAGTVYENESIRSVYLTE